MGPVCSSRYYEVEHEITPEMVMEALGVIHASGLDPQVKLTAKHMARKDPRGFSNVLVKWASAHYDQRDVVFDVADAVGALGFKELAAKLREDRTKVHLRVHEDPNTLTIHTASSWQLNRYMQRIPGVGRAPKVGRYEGWVFDAKYEQVVLTILSHVFPNQWATLKGTTGRLKNRSWYDVRDAIDALYAKPKPAPAPAQQTLPGLPSRGTHNGILRATPDGKTLEIRTPRWDGNWLAAFKNLVPYHQRKWNGSFWTCPATLRDEVAKLVAQHYQIQP